MEANERIQKAGESMVKRTSNYLNGRMCTNFSELKESVMEYFDATAQKIKDDVGIEITSEELIVCFAAVGVCDIKCEVLERSVGMAIMHRIKNGEVAKDLVMEKMHAAVKKDEKVVPPKKSDDNTAIAG